MGKAELNCQAVYAFVKAGYFTYYVLWSILLYLFIYCCFLKKDLSRRTLIHIS